MSKETKNSPQSKGESPSPSSSEENAEKGQSSYWLAWIIFGGSLLLTLVLGMLLASILERRWETMQPRLVVKSIKAWEINNAVWGQNYPREYQTFLKTRRTGTRTAFGGSYLRDYLKEDPRQGVLFAGYGFSREYKQARGHAWAVHDIKESKRTTRPDGTDTGMPATCWTCKSSSVPKLMHDLGITAFYNDTWKNMKSKIKSTIGCLDCHDPKTMKLRVSRPALREAFARRGRDIDKASHQQMRSLVCAQCHVEYYFSNNPSQNKKQKLSFARKGKYLVFPWDKGYSAESMEKYYAARKKFYDWKHPISGTRMIKMQHPDWEVYKTGIHAYRNVSCADCHMPYRTEGGVKFTNHHIQSPLLNISSSCGVCHRWSEEEVRRRVVGLQKKHYRLRLRTEDALVRAHFDVAACKEAGAQTAQLEPLRQLLWRAQLRWDYVSAHNGMGFHSPQECARLLGTSIDLAQRVRIKAARLLAQLGVKVSPRYPDLSSKKKALTLIKKFEAAAKNPALKPPSLLRPTPQKTPKRQGK